MRPWPPGVCAPLRVRVQIVLAQLFDERRATQLQQSRGMGDGTVRLCERARDQLLLDVAEVLAQFFRIGNAERRDHLIDGALPHGPGADELRDLDDAA